jgi:two-component system NtrC family response regulator
MSAPAAVHERRKLLLVQSNQSLHCELAPIFADLDVVCVDLGEQALALVRRAEPDVLLFDLGSAREPAHAPRELELLRQIVTLAPSTKIIAITEPEAR